MQKKRANLNDFDRFKVMVARIKVRVSLPFCLMIASVQIALRGVTELNLIATNLSFLQRGSIVRKELSKLKKEIKA